DHAVHQVAALLRRIAGVLQLAFGATPDDFCLWHLGRLLPFSLVPGRVEGHDRATWIRAGNDLAASGWRDVYFARMAKWAYNWSFHWFLSQTWFRNASSSAALDGL